MRFARNAKIFRGHLDIAPFLGVLFLLIIFLTLATLVYTPGVPIELPESTSFSGTDRPTLVVAINAVGQFFMDNQLVALDELKNRLEKGHRDAADLTLVVLADKSVESGVIIRLSQAASDVGIKHLQMAVRPRPFDRPPAKPGK